MALKPMMIHDVKSSRRRCLVVMVLSGFVLVTKSSTSLLWQCFTNISISEKTKETKGAAVVNRTAFLEELPYTVIDLVRSSLGQHVRLENACLELQGHQAPTLWTHFPPTLIMPAEMTQMFNNLRPDMTGLLPLRSMDASERNHSILQYASSSVEWIHDEHLLVQRMRSTNLFHWMQEGFFIHAAFPTATSGTKNIPVRRVFHIPTDRTFVNLADLSYAEFLHMIGVREQMTIHGPVSNVSLRHLDEWSEDGDTFHRWICFSKALLGLVSPNSLYLGSRILVGADRRSYKAFLNTITSNLDLPPNAMKTLCPAEITFILRHSERNATCRTRRLENWSEIQNELQTRNISYHAIDIATDEKLQSFRTQVQLAQCQRLLVAAHGQSLWLTHFNIAATNGVIHYEQMRVETPWPMVEFEQFSRIKQQLEIKMYNASQIQNVRNSLIPLLRPGSYHLVTEYLQTLGLTNADMLAKIMAREQPLVVDAQQLVDRIEHALAVVFR